MNLPILTKFQPDMPVSTCFLYGIFTNIYDTNQHSWIFSKHLGSPMLTILKSTHLPKCSMLWNIYLYIQINHKFRPNVGLYTVHLSIWLLVSSHLALFVAFFKSKHRRLFEEDQDELQRCNVTTWEDLCRWR